MSLLFIISTLYYVFNREHLKSPIENRFYLTKYKILLDILYFVTDFFYFIWVLILYFYNIKFATILTFLILCNWLLNRRGNVMIDYSFSIIKILILFLLFIS